MDLCGPFCGLTCPYNTEVISDERTFFDIIVFLEKFGFVVQDFGLAERHTDRKNISKDSVDIILDKLEILFKKNVLASNLFGG